MPTGPPAAPRARLKTSALLDEPVAGALTFHLSAQVSTESPGKVGPALREHLGKEAKIRHGPEGFEVRATLRGSSARDLNRDLLTALRRAEKRTRLRSEWTSAGVTEKFFDYVPKGTRQSP